MREIRFRGKFVYPNTQTGQFDWVCGDLVHGIEKHKIICEDGSQYEVLSSTVGQFTGLHDKNSKEIYEGDIVKLDESICIVQWHDYLAQYYLAFPGDRPPHYNDGKASIFEMMKYYTLEVIGNIYDDPELIKEK